MTIQFNCTQCEKMIETPDDSAGKKCRCPDCGHVMPIPGWDTQLGKPLDDPASYPKKPAVDPTNPYAAPQPAPSMPYHISHEQADRSVLVLVFGISSIVVSFMSCGCCLLFFPLGLGLGIPAWVMGRKDLKEIAQGQRNPSQKGLLQAGMICGIIGVSIATVLMVFRVGFVLLQFGALGLQEFGR